MPRGQYERTIIPPEDRFWKKVDKKTPDQCWLWTGTTNGRGYGKMRISLTKKISTHRFSYALHHPISIPINEIDFQVCHSCDNRTCVNPYHLRLATNLDNMNDKVERGRCNSVRGENHANAILTENDVKQIREKYATGNYSFKQLADEYNYKSTGSISDIIMYRKWTHI